MMQWLEDHQGEQPQDTPMQAMESMESTGLSLESLESTRPGFEPRGLLIPRSRKLEARSATDFQEDTGASGRASGGDSRASGGSSGLSSATTPGFCTPDERELLNDPFLQVTLSTCILRRLIKSTVCSAGVPHLNSRMQTSRSSRRSRRSISFTTALLPQRPARRTQRNRPCR